MESKNAARAIQPLAESGGAIRRIFLYDFLHGDNDSKKVLSRFSGILLAFDPLVQYVILVTFDPKDYSLVDLEKLLESIKELVTKLNRKAIIVDHLALLMEIRHGLNAGLGAKNLTVPNYTASLFAQDPFASLVGPDGEVIFLNPLVRHNLFDYYFVAEQLSSVSTALVTSTLLEFTGGNILNGEGFVLVGKDVIARNLKRNGWNTSTEIVTYIGKEFGGVEVQVTGTKKEVPKNPPFFQGLFQPVFHIDLYISLGGIWKEGSKSYQLVFVGELEEVNTGGLDPDMIKSLKRDFDEAAKELSACTLGGYPTKVVRMPLVLTANAGLGVWITFNNVVSERKAGKKIMYLPQYTDPSFQPASDTAAKIYEQYGFEITWVKGNFDFYAMNMGGSLHCIVKVTERKRS